MGTILGGTGDRSHSENLSSAPGTVRYPSFCYPQSRNLVDREGIEVETLRTL